MAVAGTSRRKKSDLSFLVGLVAAVAFFCIGGYITYSRINVIRAQVDLVTHTSDVLLTTRQLLSVMKDAETGQRGFVITGNESYLEPYTEAARQAPQQLALLQQLTMDNPEQQRRIDAIGDMIEDRLQRLSGTINLRRTQGFDAALQQVMSGEGKEIMDDLRDAVEVVDGVEVELRQKRLEAMDVAHEQALMTGIGTSAVGIILSIAITALLQRNARMRQREEWFQAGRVGLGTAMLGDLTIEQLGQNVLKFLAEYLNAQAGIFYARDEGQYRRSATYGFPSGESATEYLNKNDNLLGQAIQDRRAFVVDNVPDGYIRVGSALGESKPRHLLISPAIADDAVNAVFELGFVNGLDADTLVLLEQVSNAIGIAVQSANYRSHLQKLLEETQTQAEELQTQSEELRVSNEELEEQSQALKESQARLEQQQEELETSNEELEEQNARIRQQTDDLNESRRELQEKARELELSSKYKSEFLANMSHELRTPLNSLLILAKNLAANDDGNLTAEQVEESQIIYNGGLELLNLINDILDLSKVEAGKLSIITDDAPLQDVARRMEQQFFPVAADRGLDFSVRIAPDVPPVIHTDAQRVDQVLKNLLSNAFKFTEEGSIVLDIFRPDPGTLFQRDNLAAGQALAFAVTDTGIGIDQTKLNSIFEAFQQEDGSTDRHYGGTGLGLTIARKFAHMLGGEIHVASEKGTGSTFTLVLPEHWQIGENGGRTETERSAASRPAKQAGGTDPRKELRTPHAGRMDGAAQKGRTLLIIEDDRDFAHILAKIAQARGYRPLVAHDGKTGIVMAGEHAVSAIILDLRLPDIDGLTVLDQLKHDLRTRHIPIHIITGMPDSDAITPLRKGAIGCLNKPVAVEDIEGAFRKIEDVLRSSIKKILVVEDDRKSQAAIQTLLKKKDVNIICVGTGHTALKRLESEAFDCIILDLALPDMTGFEWLASISEQFDSESLPPVIVYTAKELTEDENTKLSQYTGSIVIKGAHSSERLLDEVTLFLHSVESTLSKDQQAIIRMQHNPDKVLQGRTVLLVDDDLRNTFALSKMLKKHGMNVVIADNGQMAIEKLAQNAQIELVIMDIMMPVMDGYQAMYKIRQNEQWHKMPIIALTARAMPEEQEKCMEAGANDYLTKPVDLEHLLTLMRVWLFRQESASS
jgi:CheY-like chemotaxis protein/signal transduction histidine kinase/CHASE3 domain sensor protein